MATSATSAILTDMTCLAAERGRYWCHSPPDKPGFQPSPPQGDAGSTREHTFGVVQLNCGHPAVVVIHPGRSIAATLKRYEWECPDTGATVAPTRVLRVLSESEYESMGQEAFDLLVSTGLAS